MSGVGLYDGGEEDFALSLQGPPGSPYPIKIKGISAFILAI